MMMDEIKANEAGFVALISQRLGLTIRHQTSEMYRSIAEACEKFSCTPTEYLQQLRVCPADSPLLEHLVLGVTIGETYFFRDKHQITLLREKILPDLIERKRSENNLSLRIWSAGCSSGEEIYTIAMLLNDLLPDLVLWTVKLIATDINTKSLKKALSGKYTEWSMRSIPDYYKKRYFTFSKNEYTLANEIRQTVDFFYLNLNEDTYPSIFNNTNAQDLIICRNVLIYFNQISIGQIMKRMHACLVPEGYLLLGASDPVPTSDNDMFSLQQGILTKTNPQSLALPAYKAVEKVPRQSTLNTRPQVKPSITAKPTVVPAKIEQSSDSLRQQLQQLQNENRWEEILLEINKHALISGNSDAFQDLQATAYANLGQLDLALTLCKASLAHDATNKFTWLTYSLILSELNQFAAAEEALRKVLFLDRQFVVGHFQLGLLLLRNKEIKQGLKSIYNALNITQQESQEKIVPGSQGLTYGVFAEILKHEIELYERKLS